MIDLFLILLMLLLTFYGGLISAWEAALFSLSSMQVKIYRQDRDPRKQLIAQILSKPRQLIVTLLILNTLPNLLVQNIAANLFGDFSSWLLKVGVPIILTLLFSEIVPKAIGFANNNRIAYQGAGHISKVQNIMKPIEQFMTLITSYVSTVLFFFLKKEEEISDAELHHVLKTSQEHGIIAPEEAELIDGYLTLQEATVKELMRPREEVLFYDLKEPLTKLIYLFVKQACSRIPVCEGGFENIRGIISAQQFFVHRNTIKLPADLLPFLQKAFFIPETTRASFLLQQFAAKGENLAIVVDEYGSIPGLITREDLAETVVGEIEDLRDKKRSFTRSGRDVIIASGKFELTEFEDLFGVTLESPGNMITIGGWLTEQLGDIPKSGQQYLFQNFLFIVLAADPNRVRRVYIRHLSSKKMEELKKRRGAT